jgi:hypothetical protein
MAGCFPTQIVKSYFVTTSPTSLKRIHFSSHLSVIIPSSSGCPGSNASIPRSTGHPKLSHPLYFPYMTNLRHHPTKRQSPIQNLHLSKLHNLNAHVTPNHDDCLNQNEHPRPLQSPNHRNHQILLRDRNPWPSKTSHAPRAIPKTPPLHPRPPKANREQRNLAHLYHAGQRLIAGLIHGH